MATLVVALLSLAGINPATTNGRDKPCNYKMDFRLVIAIMVGKLVAAASRLFNIGAGSTWSGEVALRIEPRLIAKLIKGGGGGGGIKKTILIAGTNGKTTTTKMIKTLLEDDPLRGLRPRIILSNEAGANLLNGIAGALIRKISFISPISSIRTIGIFEVDEATLPLALEEFTPQIVVILNLFRDQLDRYGEVKMVANKWLKSLKKLKKTTTVILNADDPQVAYFGRDLKAKVKYFGMRENLRNNLEKVVPYQGDLWGDSLYCPKCGRRLRFKRIYFSHLGDWECLGCGLKRPKLDFEALKLKISLEGQLNFYNGAAAVLAANSLQHAPPNRRATAYSKIAKRLRSFVPAFGRQEEIRVKGEKRVKILLSKNPTGLNENLRMVREMRDMGGVLLVLNDRIPDGRDVSWIWDIDTEPLVQFPNIIISGDRCYDMALRVKYGVEIKNEKFPPKAGPPLAEKMKNYKAKLKNSKTIQQFSNITIEKNLREAINLGLGETDENQTLYILPTYSAMLEVRKILLGKAIL